MGQGLTIDQSVVWARFRELSANSERVRPAPEERPFLAQARGQIALRPESETIMPKFEPAAGEPDSDAKVLYLSPADARRRLFFTVDRVMAAAARRGSVACSRATHRADRQLASEAGTGFVVVDAGMEQEARTVLRARCAICPSKCARPLI